MPLNSFLQSARQPLGLRSRLFLPVPLFAEETSCPSKSYYDEEAFAWEHSESEKFDVPFPATEDILVQACICLRLFLVSLTDSCRFWRHLSRSFRVQWVTAEGRCCRKWPLSSKTEAPFSSQLCLPKVIMAWLGDCWHSFRKEGVRRVTASPPLQDTSCPFHAFANNSTLVPHCLRIQGGARIYRLVEIT